MLIRKGIALNGQCHRDFPVIVAVLRQWVCIFVDLSVSADIGPKGEFEAEHHL
jgi:hypothetical protein